MNPVYHPVTNFKEHRNIQRHHLRPMRAKSSVAAWRTDYLPEVTLVKDEPMAGQAVGDPSKLEVVRSRASYQFGHFTIDRGRFELRFKGQSVPLERKPLELLMLLASRAGSLVSRAEIAEKLWEREVFVDTEHGINTAIRKIRLAIKDDAANPRLIQTVVGMDYRFVAQIHVLLPSPSSEIETSAALPCSASSQAVEEKTRADQTYQEAGRRVSLRGMCARPICAALESLIQSLSQIHLWLQSP